MRRCHRHRRRGFSLVELMVVVACLAVAAALVVPLAADGPVGQLRAAADLLVSDLEFAQTESIGRADDPRFVVFDSAANRYHVAARSAPALPLTDPVSQGPYVTAYGAGRAAPLARVRIAGLSLGGDNRLGFRGVGELDQGAPATITLAAGDRSITVTVDPVTGEATVGEIRQQNAGKLD